MTPLERMKEVMARCPLRDFPEIDWDDPDSYDEIDKGIAFRKYKKARKLYVRVYSQAYGEIFRPLQKERIDRWERIFPDFKVEYDLLYGDMY